MRNLYPGVCYRCGKPVAVGDGFFHKYKGKWATHHAECAIKAREDKLNGD